MLIFEYMKLFQKLLTHIRLMIENVVSFKRFDFDYEDNILKLGFVVRNCSNQIYVGENNGYVFQHIIELMWGKIIN